MVSQGDCECGKRHYRSKSEARWVAAQTRRSTGETIRAYKCPFDRRWWHIGHAPRRPQPAHRAELRAAVRGKLGALEREST